MTVDNSQEKISQNNSYEVQVVGPEVIKNFVETHGGEQNEKYWVGMGGEFGWADGYPLFTFGSSTCLVPVFIKEDNKTGMGHLPYVFIDKETVDEGIADISVEEKINNAKKKLTGDEPEKWTMYLFGGQPYDNTERCVQNAQTNKTEFMNIFRSIGLTVYDHTTTDPNKVINGLILDPSAKKIQVEFETLA